MSDIFEEVEEDLRRDRLHQLWHRHRWAIFGAAVLIVAGTAGMVSWQNWQRQKNEAQGAQFAEAAASATADPAKAEAALEVLAQGGGDGYRLLARFRAATLKAKGTDKPGGIAALQAIAADQGVDQAYRDLATVLAGLYQVDDASKADIAAKLQPLTVAPDPWRFTALEVTALADLKAGDQESAIKLYQQLADDLDAPRSARARAAEIIEALRHQG